MSIKTTYQDSIVQKDTVFGINNEMPIPIRQAPIRSIAIKNPIETLFNPQLKVVEVANWQMLILLLTILFMGFVKAFSNNRFKQGIKALLNYSVAQEITREEKVFFHRSNLFFTAIHLLTTALFVFQLRDGLNSGVEEVNNFSFFLSILVFLCGMYSVKYIFFRLLSFTFNDVSVALEYIFNVSLYNSLQGALFIPILSVAYFTEVSIHFTLLYIAIPLLIFVFLLRLFRLLKIGQHKGVSYVYIFVYICTLEILPLVVLYRIFIR